MWTDLRKMVNYYKDAQLFYKIFFRLESQETKAYNKKVCAADKSR